MDKITIIFNRLKQSIFGRILIHVLFWVIIGCWFFFDYFTVNLFAFDATSLPLLGNFAFIIVCFYALSISLKKSFPNRFYIFFIAFIITFIASEYFIHYYFLFIRYYRSPDKNATDFISLLQTDDKVWWKVFFDRKVIYRTMSFHFFYLIIPFSIYSIYTLLGYVRSNARLEKENLQLELNFLRSQVNPHFLFNTLNNITSMAVDTDERVANAIIKLSDLMRYTLYESNQEKIALSREITFLNDYIELERIRLTKRASVEFEKNTEGHGLRIPPLILLTFVENAFKHSIHSTTEAAWVKINLSVQKDTLSFVVENSLPKKSVITNLNKAGGIGLENAKKRLELYYHKKYTLDILVTEAVYLVQLKITLNRDQSA
jgi:two-component system LytT family sensor kinase